MRILFFHFWPIWLLLAIAIVIILIVNKKSAKASEDEAETPRIIGMSRAGFLITCLVFGTIISGFIWLGSKLEKDTSHDYTPTKIEGGVLKKGNVQ